MRENDFVRRGLAAALLLVALASCHRGLPSGQVAATVDGEEITAAELRLEMGGGSSDGAAGNLQQNALQRLIARKLLTKEAHRQGLDKGPVATAVHERAREVALAQLLEAKLARAAPLDQSNAAIDRFISAHPVQFSDRRLISVEQLLVPSEARPLMGQIGALKSLSAIEELLARNNIGSVRSASVLDTSSMPPELATRLVALGTDQLFVVPINGNSLNVSRIVGSRTLALAGDDARAAARRLMEQDRANAARGEMRKIIDQGRRGVWIDPALAKS